MVTCIPPAGGPWSATTEATCGDRNVNCEAATTGLVPAEVPVVVTVTPVVPPKVTSGVTTVTDVGVDPVTWAVTPPKWTTGMAEPKPDPVTVTVVPPTAGPDEGFSPVTVGHPAADPDSRASRAPARGLPYPVSR